MPRREKQAIAWFCCLVIEHLSWGEEASVPGPAFGPLSVCCPGKSSFKMPIYPSKKGHKELPWFQWHGFNRKEGLSTQLFYISWHSPWKSQMWRKSQEEGSESTSPTSQLCVCDQKLLLMGPDTTNPIFFSPPFPNYKVESMFLSNLILFKHFGYTERIFIRALLKASAMERKAKPT